MTRIITLLSLFALLILPTRLSAQEQEPVLDERAPGIYSIVGGLSFPLSYTWGWGKHKNNYPYYDDDIIPDVCDRYAFKGLSSGVTGSDTFVMVIDPKQRSVMVGLRRYTAFHQKMSPVNILVIRLEINESKKRREYDTNNAPRLNFDWKQITDNSFEIHVYDLEPGEYAFLFRFMPLCDYHYNAIYGFSIP